MLFTCLDLWDFLNIKGVSMYPYNLEFHGTNVQLTWEGKLQGMDNGHSPVTLKFYILWHAYDDRWKGCILIEVFFQDPYLQNK